MARGLPHAPRWAWGLLGAAAVIFVVLGLVAATRSSGDPLTPAERARLDAAASAAAKSDEAEAAARASAEAAPSASEPQTLDRPDDGPLRVLFAGDSLTAGAFAMTEAEAFRSLVVDKLDDGGDVEPTRIGDSGLRASDVLPEVPDAGEGYDLVVVELGTNDAAQSSLGAFRQDYPQFLDAVREHSPDAILLCTGIWGQDSGQAREMDRVIKGECENRDGGFVPLGEIYADPSNRGPAGTVRPADGAVLDNFHPNNGGHSKIATAILNGLDVTG